MRRTNVSTAIAATALALMLILATPSSAAVLTTSPGIIVGLPQVVTLGPESPPVGPGGGGWTFPGNPVKIYASPFSGPAMNIPIGVCNVDALGNLTSSASPGSACTFTATINTADGSYELTATQSGGPTTNAAQFVATGSTTPIAVPTITASPTTFAAADTVTLTGCGWQVFGITTNLDIYAASIQNGPGSYVATTNVAVSPTPTSTCAMGGTWQASFVFDQNMPTGTYYVQAYRAGAGGAQSALVQASQAYPLTWVQPSTAATAVSANPSFTG